MIDKISMLKDKKWTDKIINNKRNFFLCESKTIEIWIVKASHGIN